MDTRGMRLKEIVGVANVVDDAETLSRYARDESFTAARMPWHVVKPGKAEEIQALVKWANETATPLIPLSSGPPHFYGDTVPSVAEAVIVDLSGMKKILRIDRRNKIAVIEPGVTYSELKPALEKQGLRMSQPLLPRANKSVIASLLERQPTTIPRLNFSMPEPLRDCGVVWGTGESAFTGEAGAGPLSLEEQWKRNLAQVDPKGPGATDLMRLLTGAQGTMGIVVWASVKCELIPTAHKCCFVPGKRLDELIDFCYKLERIRLGDEVFILNRTQLLRLIARGDGSSNGSKQDLPPWVVVIGLAGAALFPEERLAVQEKDLKELTQSFGLELKAALPGVANAEVMNLFGGCSSEPHWKMNAKGACQDIFFLSTLEKAPRFISTMQAVAEQHAFPASEIGIYIQPQHHGVSQHVEFSLPFNPRDKNEAEQIKDIYSEASEQLRAQGAYFSRPYGSWADMVYSHDATAKSVLRTVKQIVDPNNILNPGKLCF